MKYSSSYLRHNEKKKSWQGFLRYKGQEGTWRQMGKTFLAMAKIERQEKSAWSIPPKPKQSIEKKDHGLFVMAIDLVDEENLANFIMKSLYYWHDKV